MITHFPWIRLRRIKKVKIHEEWQTVRVRKVTSLSRGLVDALRRDVFGRRGGGDVDGNIIPDREAWHMGTWGTSYLHITHSSWFSIGIVRVFHALQTNRYSKVSMNINYSDYINILEDLRKVFLIKKKNSTIFIYTVFLAIPQPPLRQMHSIIQNRYLMSINMCHIGS